MFTLAARFRISSLACDEVPLPLEPNFTAPGAVLYVDPWEARWADDTHNEFRWDTSQVPDGDYYVLAELSDAVAQANELIK